MYYVYMLRCRGGTLYTGLTNELRHRMRCHAGLLSGGAKYTRSHPPEKLEALWRTEGKADAARMECAVKTLTRQQKETLVAAPERLFELLPRLSGGVYTHIAGITLQDCLEGEISHGD